MYIIVNHFIKAPHNFWALVREKANYIPSHLIFHSVFPSKDLMKAVCVWEAEDIDTVKKYLDETFGDFSRNDYYEVNSSATIGLPLQYRKTASL
jgi:hypothetical protein